MPSLLKRLGHRLELALKPLTVKCALHGPQAWAPACKCVLDGGIPAQSTMDGVLCATHVAWVETGDDRADDDVVPVCLACLAARGLFGAGDEVVTPA